MLDVCTYYYSNDYLSLDITPLDITLKREKDLAIPYYFYTFAPDSES